MFEDLSPQGQGRGCGFGCYLIFLIGIVKRFKEKQCPQLSLSVSERTHILLIRNSTWCSKWRQLRGSGAPSGSLPGRKSRELNRRSRKIDFLWRHLLRAFRVTRERCGTGTKFVGSSLYLCFEIVSTCGPEPTTGIARKLPRNANPWTAA